MHKVREAVLDDAVEINCVSRHLGMMLSLKVKRLKSYIL
ncbi:hypothetical protein JCM19241_5225 [Vibrio ishigakensis]|uniref:Uncharacterized protein n=1 Tax=Vibrio ishigakensis TaxID=1481914 RepID=A0A0B8QHD6_9VIBR|nr:hypothetical protein JCM19241_5225 [Vibrio ishigakensis]